MNKTKRIENTFDVVRILIAILLAYLIALIILALISDDPWNVISLFIIGPFNSKKHVGDIFTLMIPLVFTGLCMCFVYAINKFNLAGEGAVNLGGCLAACVAIALRDTAVPGWIAIILCIIVGALAGMLSTAIPAIADQVFHADVCVISLMLNYILLYFTTYILKNVIKDQGASVTASYKLGRKVKLANLIPGTQIHIGLLIALACVVFRRRQSIVCKVHRNPGRLHHHPVAGHRRCICGNGRLCSDSRNVPSLQMGKPDGIRL